MNANTALSENHAPRAFTIADETIERFLVNDLPAAERNAVRTAIDSDAALRAYVDARETERRAFVFEAPRLPLPTPTPRGARALTMRFTAFAGALAMACGLLFMIVRDGSVGEVRTRGGALAVDVVVRRGDRLFDLAPGVPLRPGDTLRVEVTSPRAGFVSAVLVDARGAALVYDAVTVPRGAFVLPDSLVLDDVTGAEALHVVFTSSRPVRSAIVEAVARDAADAGEARAVVTWHKEPRP